MFNTTLVVTSPGMGQGVAKAITQGWQLSPIVSLFTGNPIQLSEGGKDISLSGQGLDRPNVVAPDQVYNVSAGDPPYWFNPTAFAVQAAGTFGNLGRNAVYGPGQINWDMAISRRFQFSEAGRVKLDLRADFFNIMNHANWNNPGTSNQSSTFGEVTTFGSPRVIQMALKLFF